VNAAVSRSLWHNRLRHPSSEVMSTFFRSIGIVGDLKERRKLMFVRYAIVLSKLEIDFLLVIIKQVNYLSLFIVIFGDLIESKPLVVQAIFSL